MTDHERVALYFPEAYSGTVTYLSKTYSIIERATELNLPPIIKRYGQWGITPNGLVSLAQEYLIVRNRVYAIDWIEQMQSKEWVNIDEFKQAYEAAREFIKLKII